jgi:ubiquinone/menaquinone biosynthesis C-methylase UbiE
VDDLLKSENGSFVPAILSAAPQVHYTGCDYSSEMVGQALARNQATVERGQALFLVGEAGSLPFPKGQFDKVLTVNTIYFWEQPEAVLAGLYRVLKPSGTLLIGLWPKASMQHYPFVSYGFWLYDASEVTALLSAAGFRVLSTEEEPNQEIDGQPVRVDGLVVVAQKPG